MKRLPLLAIILGLGGLVPFVCMTVAILFFPSDVPVPRLIVALVDYGAAILSFLGAVHWGLALAGDPLGVPGQPAAMRLRLGLGVLPALVGLARHPGAAPLIRLLLLLLGFALTMLAEPRAARHGLMPPGYLGLRYLLTAVVLLCLFAALVVRLA